MSITIEPTETTVPTISTEEEKRRDILLRAAEIIEARGYTTGNKGMTVVGEFCLMGAVGYAMGIPANDVWMLDGKYVPAYEYEPVEKFLATHSMIEDPAWIWSDAQQSYPNPAERVAAMLRKMANGATFEEATR